MANYLPRFLRPNHHSRCILGAFAKLPKSTISFVMSVRPSVHMEQLCSQWKNFHEIWYFKIFRKFIKKIQISLKLDNRCLWLFISHFFVEIKMFLTNVVKKIKRPFLFNFSFFKNRASYEIMWKNIVERGRPQMTIRHMRNACRIAKYGRTLRLCNNHCYSITIMVV